MNSNEAFKDRLHRALEKSRLGTQKALADRMDVREATVSGWFNGAWPREDQLRGLIDVLGVSGHWLVSGEGPMRPEFETDSMKLEVIGMVVNEEVDPLALKLFAEDAAGQGMGAAAAQAKTAALERGAEPIDPEHEETDGPDGPDGSTDRSTDDGNGPPDTTRHAAP